MSHEERLEILTSIYRKALGLGVVKTSKEFAEALERAIRECPDIESHPELILRLVDLLFLLSDKEPTQS